MLCSGCGTVTLRKGGLLVVIQHYAHPNEWVEPLNTHDITQMIIGREACTQDANLVGLVPEERFAIALVLLVVIIGEGIIQKGNPYTHLVAYPIFDAARHRNKTGNIVFGKTGRVRITTSVSIGKTNCKRSHSGMYAKWFANGIGRRPLIQSNLC